MALIEKQHSTLFKVKIIAVLVVWIAVFYFVYKILNHSQTAVIDPTHPEFATGIFVTPGKYRIRFSGGWNLNRHEPHPKSTRETLIGPEGIPDWDIHETRRWAFPELGKFCTGVEIGKWLIPAHKDFILTVEKNWLGSLEKAEIVVLINDIAGTHYDNGNGLMFTRFAPMWRIKSYKIIVDRLSG